MQEDRTNSGVDANQTFVEGVDFYFEDSLMVLTRRYLVNRGHCCENSCRHCPYEKVSAAGSE